MNNNILEKIKNLPKNQQLALMVKLKAKKSQRIKNSISKIEKQDSYPLSYSQEKFWYAEKLTSQGLNNITGTITLRGNLDVSVLEKSFQKTIKKNPALRTIFFEDKGIPYQKTKEETFFKIHEIDFTERNQSGENIHSYMKEIASEKLDLQKEVLKVFCFKISETETILLNVIHHIISDAWSIRLFIQAVFSEYNFLVGASQNEPVTPEFSYTDYSSWYRNNIERNESQKLAFWNEYLQDKKDILDILAKQKGEENISLKAVKSDFKITAEQMIVIKNYCQKKGLTPFALFFAALNILLYRYSAQDDILVGIPVSGRNTKESAPIMGCFINTLPARTFIDGTSTISDFLQKVKINILKIMENQDFPFEKIVKETCKNRDITYSPLVQCLFNYIENASSPFTIHNASVEEVSSLDLGFPTNELELQLIYESEQIHGWFRHGEGSIDAHLSTTFIRHYLSIIHKITEDDTLTIDALDFLSDQEKQSLIHEFNDSKMDFDSTQLITQIMDKYAQEQPHSPALFDQSESMTYKTLVKHSNALANELLDNGVKVEDVVGIFFDSSKEFVISALGILKAGAAFVALDPKLPEERIKMITSDANINIVISHTDLVPMLPENIGVIDLNALFQLNQFQSPHIQISPDNLAYVLYTSGTTEKPKGVMIEHGSLMNLCTWVSRYYNLSSKDRFSKYATIGFDASILEIFPILSVGGSLYIIPQEIRHDINKINAFFNDNSISIAFLPTPIAEEFMKVENSCLRVLLTGGDKLNHFIKKNYLFTNAYGPTENTVITTNYDVEKWSKNIPIGKPVANTEVYILNRNSTENKAYLQPLGVAGELCISGKSLSRGYLNNPDLTNEKFINHPFKQGEKIYKSGDLARIMPNGNIQFLGRIDSQIKINGYRIEPQEIESQLLFIEGITNAKVILSESESGNKFLCAYYISNRELDNSFILKELEAALPFYMIPQFITRLEDFELTTNGKIDLKKLPKMNFVSQKEKVFPQTETEEQLLNLWKKILGLKDLSTDDNFYEIGGHSLLVVRLLAEIANLFQVEVFLMDFLSKPNIIDLAKLIDGTLKPFEKTELVNLQEEAHLEELPVQPQNQSGEVENIFFTGATGFVGSFLLKELVEKTSANIYTLVRAKSPEEGKTRLEDSFKYYGLDLSILDKRVFPVPGCLSKKQFDLSENQWNELTEKIDCIYHGGAFVHHFLPYEFLKETNVQGTKEIIKMATTCKMKKINHISSLGIFTTNGNDQFRKITESQNIEEEFHFKHSGYNASKWVSEKIILNAIDQGVDCRIFRLGRVTPCSKTGKGNSDDYFSRFIKSCLLVNKYPLNVPEESYLPVDLAAEIIVSISQSPQIDKQIFHVIDENKISLSKVMNSTKMEKINVDEVAFHEWLEIIEKGKNIPIEPYIPLFKEIVNQQKQPQTAKAAAGGNDFCNLETRKSLAIIGKSLPEIDDEYYVKLVKNLSIN